MSDEPAKAAAVGNGYPMGKTRVVARGLAFFSIVCVVAFFLVITPAPDPTKWWVLKGALRDAAIATLAAGIGSGIATIRAFLRHACERKDFRDDYIPWYIFRPLMGMLLGLVFYFVLRGGLLATVTIDDGILKMDQWAVAGISSLVGMFSKQAIEKLSEVFHTLVGSAPGSEEPPAPDPNAGK